MPPCRHRCATARGARRGLDRDVLQALTQRPHATHNVIGQVLGEKRTRAIDYLSTLDPEQDRLRSLSHL